jgi:uncharacterized protein
MSTPKAERREIRDVIQSIELRAAPEGSKSPGTIVGYAAMFDTYSTDLGCFRERLKRGAFTKCLARCDVRCLKNHDPNMLLGRTSSGTFRLSEDELGLRMECDLPDTTVGRDTAEEIRRGDLKGQSFSFTTGIDEWDWSDEPAKRTVVEVDELFDAGPVTFPAYEETSVALRSYTAAKATLAKPPHELEHERDTARLRLLEVS